MSCHCDVVWECEPAYIPNGADTGNNYFVAIKQWQCWFCGKKWGYVGQGVKVVEGPKEVKK